MRRSKVRKLVKKVTCLICVIAVYVVNSERIYAIHGVNGASDAVCGSDCYVLEKDDYETRVENIMKVWNRTNILTGMILCLVCITACSKTDNVQPENNAAAEPQAEEMLVQTEENEKIKLVGIKTVISPDGMSCMIALDENGNVWQWGEKENREDAEPVADLNSVVKIMDAGSAVYALTKEGAVYAWGSNEWLMIAPKESREMTYENPVKLDALSNIVDMDVGNGKAFAVDNSGKLYIWGLDRYSSAKEDKQPEPLEEQQVLKGGIKNIFMGAGNFHYLVGQDGNVFSIMDAEYTLDHLKHYIFPCFSDEEPVVDWRGNTKIFDIDKGSKTGIPILYEMGENREISLIAADGYTMYLYREDNTLWYWNSDRITYHDNESAGALVETAYLDYRGNFEQVNIREILGMEEDSGETPRIISICPGIENVLFLLDNGQVFMSGYFTKEVRDIEYYNTGNTNPYRLSKTSIYHQMHLKELDFGKLDFENIVNISSDKKNKFFLVDKDGNIYCYQMETE